MPSKNNVAHELAVLSRIIEDGGRSFDGRLDFNKSGAPQAQSRTRGILEKPGLVEVCKEWRKLRSRGQRVRPIAQGDQIWTAAALGLQPSSRNQRPAQVRK